MVGRITEIIGSSPAKLIISGEYSILYGEPALITPIGLYMQVKISQIQNRIIEIRLCDLGTQVHFDIASITNFNKGETALSHEEKVLMLMQVFFSTYNISLKSGIRISVSSEIPIGSGFGSSAALIIALLRALHKFFHIPVVDHVFLEIAHEIEHLYHGKSSGVDIYACYYDKALLCNIDGNGLHYEELQTKHNFKYLITGKPECTTADCVAYVKKHFKASDTIWRTMGDITHALKFALRNNDITEARFLIKENHKCLVTLNVVPKAIQELITQIEENNGVAAKICGAGAIAGEKAGAVLVI